MIADIFYPILTLTITVLAYFMRERNCSGALTHALTRALPRAAMGLTLPPRPPAVIVFGFVKNRSTHFFSVFSSARPIKHITQFLHRLQSYEALQTPSKILWFINFKKAFLKSPNLMPFTWILVLFLGPCTPDCVQRKCCRFFFATW